MPDGNRTADIITVLSLNLRFGLADDGPHCWRNRKPAVAELLGQHPADFFCFQEANDFQVSEIQQILPGYAHIGQRSPAPSFWQNNVIFYHRSFHCSADRHFYLSPTPAIPSRFRDSRWPRQCTIGVFHRRNQAVACANTHLDFDAEVQRRSADVIVGHLMALPRGMPTVLSGDFNATPQSACHRVFEQAGLKNVWDSRKPGTYHGFSGKVQGGCIDWILFGGGLSAVQAAVIRDRYAGRYPSDHFPIRAEFIF